MGKIAHGPLGRWGNFNRRMTRMRVLHCKVKLTGMYSGKIDRSADALQKKF
jgi:hypothetical protein